jgi:gliding motility-associated-like protein
MEMLHSYGNFPLQRSDNTRTLKWSLAFLLVSGLTMATFAQNLAPNPSFEFYLTCPFNYNGGQPLPCVPWINPTPGTSDYYNACDNPGPVGVPDNTFGYQDAHTGVAYCGFYVRTNNGNYHEYLQAPLLSPLVAGVTYHVSFWVSPADTYCGTYNIGAYFSASPPTYSGTNEIPATPQIESTLGYISDIDNWTLISGCFVASGGESFITIGNYFPITQTPTDPACPHPPVYSYYYIDDIEVIAGVPADMLDIDLGDPVSVCDQYEIAPGIDGVSYLWEDGSNGNTLTVSESGFYAVTISDGCNFGVDSLQVTILGAQSPIDLGPEDITICSDEGYQIQLDPQWSYTWNDGSTSSNFTITDAGYYRVTMNDGCHESIDDINVSELDPPQPLSLGEDTYLCSGEEIDYSFDPSLGSFLWQDNSTAPTYSINQPGDYSLSISNLCGVVSDEITIVGINLPQVDLGQDVLLCPNGTVTFELDADLGTYTWQNGLVSPVYTITEDGQYSVTIYNQCGSDVDTVSVSYVAPPSLNLAMDTTLCPSQLPFTLNLSNTPNATEFTWQDGSTSSSYTVTTSGVYTVTVSNSCSSVTGNVTVNVSAGIPDAVLPQDLELCQGENYVLSNNGSAGQFLWQDGSTADSLVVTAPGTYSLTVSNVCGTSSDSVLVHYLPTLSQPNLGIDFSLCSGDEVVLTTGVQGVSYLWQDFSTADTFLVTSPGIYFVQVSDACTSRSDTIVIDDNNLPPNIDLPDQLTLCQGQSLTLEASLPGVSFSWSDGSHSSMLTVSNPGAYSVTVSNACGTDADTVLVVDGGSVPFVSLGDDVQLCPGDVVMLTPAFSNVSDWLWSNGSTANSYSVNSDEIVTVEVTNACGNAFDTLTATILPATPPIDLGADTSLCPGTTLLLSVNTPAATIVWSDGSANNQYLVTGPGIYSAMISNSCGENMDTIRVGLLPAAPTLDLGNDQSLCAGESITLDPGLNNVGYLWQDGSTSPYYTATQAGTIILTVNNVCGTASDTVWINESNEGPAVNLGPDVVACEGDVITLMSDVSGVDYLWQDGSTDSHFSTTSPGEFILQVSNHCGSDVDTVVVHLLAPPETFDLGPDTTLCPGASIVLHAPSTSFAIKWQDGSNSPTFLADKAQTYSLELSNQCGSSSDKLILNYDQRVPSIQMDSVMAWCPGTLLPLDVTQPFPVTYQWNTSSDSPLIEVDGPGHFAVDIQAPCAAIHGETEVVIADSCTTENSFFIPNVFSPNGDNVNDVFTMSMSDGIEVQAIQTSIFDRWGNVVFESKTIPFQWKGDFNGAPLNPGVFVYRIEVHYFDRQVERSVLLSGDITLVR